MTAESCDVAAASSSAIRKRVRFCSFDFSAVDMPWDTADDSDLSGVRVMEKIEGDVFCSIGDHGVIFLRLRLSLHPKVKD